MRRLLCIALLMLTAARVPEPGITDPHIQSIAYVPDEVVLLRGAVGWQIMLEFGPDERIENVSIGTPWRGKSRRTSARKSCSSSRWPGTRLPT